MNGLIYLVGLVVVILAVSCRSLGSGEMMISGWNQPRPPVGVPSSRYSGWTPAILRAFVATALSSILVAFGATGGFGDFVDGADLARRVRAALWLLSGLYLIIQAALSLRCGRLHCASH